MHFDSRCIFGELLLRTWNKHTEEFVLASVTALALAAEEWLAVLGNGYEWKPVELLPVADPKSASAGR